MSAFINVAGRQMSYEQFMLHQIGAASVAYGLAHGGRTIEIVRADGGDCDAFCRRIPATTGGYARIQAKGTIRVELKFTGKPLKQEAF